MFNAQNSYSSKVEYPYLFIFHASKILFFSIVCTCLLWKAYIANYNIHKHWMSLSSFLTFRMKSRNLTLQGLKLHCKTRTFTSMTFGWPFEKLVLTLQLLIFNLWKVNVLVFAFKSGLFISIIHLVCFYEQFL